MVGYSKLIHNMKINIIILLGGTNNGLIVHPNGKYVLYPLGNKVAIQEWSTKKQSFLVGHTNIISSIAVSKSGKYVASGQINHIGFKVNIYRLSNKEKCKLSTR